VGKDIGALYRVRTLLSTFLPISHGRYAGLRIENRRSTAFDLRSSILDLQPFLLEENVDRAEMVALIRGGVHAPGGVWADLGAGTGNFTWALRELLGARGAIYAVDRDRTAIERQRAAMAQAAAPSATILPIQADFTRPLALPLLDGVLMANALHFVPDQPATLALVVGYLRPGGRLLVVEYDVDAAMAWVPFPVPFQRFQTLAAQAGLADPALVGTRRSPSTGVVMYAGVAVRRTENRPEGTQPRTDAMS
jgi:ubiquinone/menaquinone biosynthesis C-methylase UbiE